MITISLFAAIAGVARLAQDAAIAWRHGTGPLVDAYYFGLGLVGWPVAVALSVLTLLVAPVHAVLDPLARASDRFAAELLGAVLCFSAVAFPLSWWGLAVIAGGPLGGLGPEASAWAKAGAPALAMTVPLGLIGALLAAWLVAGGHRVLTLLEALPPLALTAALLLLPGSVLFWGTAAGVALQLLGMTLVLLSLRALPMPRLGFTSPAWRGLGCSALVLLAAQSLFALVPLVDSFFAARLGEVASLSFANRLVLGLQGLLGLALQRAGLPVLARLSHEAPERARRSAARWALAAAAVGALIGAIVAAASDFLIGVLFERGLFTPDDRARVAQLLRWGMLQMPPFLAALVLGTALAAARRSRWLAGIATAGFVVKLALSAALTVAFGTVGLLMATALMYVTTTLMAVLALRLPARR